MFPSAESPRVPNSRTQRSHNMGQSQSLYNQPLVQDIRQFESPTDKTVQKLRFESPSQSSVHEYEPLSLPKIESYIPAGTDLDAATALTALYRSHCTSLVDAIRFVKQKTFFHLFTSFHGTLTMPVQKLFAHPSISPWVEECDFVMYQKMMRVVAHLTLEVVPQAILDVFREISHRLVSHIQNAFHGQPSHVIQAKVTPATLFAGLLDRMCRVNLTAHAAANMLCHAPNRDQMYEDWIGMVRLRKVAECVPTRAMDNVVNLILTELRGLLDPVSVPWEVEGLTPYGDMAFRSGRQEQNNSHAEMSTENVLDRWVNFLSSIPGRFPYASPAEIVWCVQRVGTAVMRDLTINSGQSFGAWWVTKCWIDEMISFMAEKGGFMEYKTTYTFMKKATGQSHSNGAATHIEAQCNSGCEDFNHTSHDSSIASQIASIPHLMDSSSQAGINIAPEHDDSGIGMRSDEDFSMSKCGFSDIHIQDGTAAS
jgi:regulatory factor X, other